MNIKCFMFNKFCLIPAKSVLAERGLGRGHVQDLQPITIHHGRQNV